MKKNIVMVAVFLSLSQISNAQGFLQQLQNKLNQAAAGGGSATGGDAGGISAMCTGYAPVKQKDLAGSSPEQLVGKYFKMSSLFIDGLLTISN